MHLLCIRVSIMGLDVLKVMFDQSPINEEK